VDFQDIFREIATSQGFSVMLAGRKVTSVQIVQTNPLVENRITVEVVEPHLEVAVAARTTTEKEAGTLGG
jgi:predicted cobalt transporter CbtA